MLLAEVVEVSVAVAATRARKEKVAAIADLLRRASPADIGLAASYLAGLLPQGRFGVGWAALQDLEAAPVDKPRLTLTAVDERIDEAASSVGPGSESERREILARLLQRATADEQAFLTSLLLGEVRHGALEGVVTEAVAEAAGVAAPEIRRALMLGAGLGEVAQAALEGGSSAVARFRLTLFRPLRPMLAASAPDVATGLERLGTAAVEYKFDGARIQVHRAGDRVAVYTRTMREITERVPEIGEVALAFPAERFILDGEALAIGVDGRPRPFQETAGRFGTDEAVGTARLTPVFFDLLHLDGADLVDRTAGDRFSEMAGILPDRSVAPRIVTDSPGEAASFLESALDAGHEGVVLKSVDAPYQAGRRGSAWIKVKPVHTLDLVVLAAEWGHGRRRGRLSNLHLGARDPEGGGFVMLGKTFKGLTDEMLAWQTERFLGLEERRSRTTVFVRPLQVVEIAFDGVQTSSRYPGGVALRFARVRRYRDDKPAEEADTIETVRAIHRGEIRPR